MIAPVPAIERIERIERTGDSQTVVVVAVAGGVPVAVGGTQIVRVIVPRAAAHHALEYLVAYRRKVTMDITAQHIPVTIAVTLVTGDRVHAEVIKSVDSADTKRRMEHLEPWTMTPEQTAMRVRADYEKTATLIKQVDAKSE